MGEDKWVRRRPGSISGTVMPPPAQDGVAPPSTGQAAHAHAADQPQAQPERPQAPADQPKAPAESADATHGIREAAPRVPDSLRSHFKPVLNRPSEPSAAAPPEPPGGRRGVALLVLCLAAVLLAATGITVAVLGEHSSSQNPATSGPGSASLAAATTARAKAARWIAREISPSAIIGCDTVMCAALQNAGVPSSALLVIRPTTPDPLGADVIVATQVLRSQFGTRLSTEYAPAVLATFGAGPTRVAVRVVAVDGAKAYESALRQDIAARKRDGAALLANRRISMPSAAKVALAAGLVDPRLLVILPALAAAHPIQILGFYDQAPRSSPGVPFAGVWLSGADRQAGLRAPAYRHWLLSFLRSQQSTYLPASITSTVLHGRPAVAVRFSRPNPLGLLQSS